MRLRRAIVSSVALAVLISFSGACGGSSQSFSQVQQERAAEAKAAAAKARAAAAAKARAAAAAQEKAAAAERRRAAIEAEMRRRARAGTTTSTAPATPTTPTSPTSPTVPIDSTPADLATVRRTLDRLNSAFGAGIAAGIAHSESINYWVDTGVYTARQCAAFEAARGGGVVRESLSVRTGSFAPDPGWRDPVVGSKPAGRVYRLVVDDLQTLVPTGEQRRRSFPIHATVLPDGRALLFLRCA